MDVKRAPDRLLKRIYADEERSLELISDVDQLLKREAFFNLQLERPSERYDAKGDWRAVVKEFMGDGSEK